MPDDGMSAVAEAPETAALVPETDSASEQPESQGSESRLTDDSTAQQQRPAEDGRKIPNELRDTFKANPRLRDQWFKGSALLQKFPEGVRQAEALISEVESVTSQYGATSLAEVVESFETQKEEWNNLDSLYTEGNPEFVNLIANENPEAFAKMVPAALDTLARLDSDTYNHLMARVIVNTINGPIAEVYNALMADDKTKAAGQKLAEWYNSLDAIAKQQPEKKVSKEAERLQREREQFEAQRQEAYKSDAEKQMGTFSRETIESTLRAEFKRIGQTLEQYKRDNPDGYELMLSNCGAKINSMIPKAEFQQYVKLLESGDLQRALKYGQARVKMQAAKAVNLVFRAMNKNIGSRPAKQAVVTNRPGQPQPRQAGSSSATPLGRQPKHQEIDWPRMRNAGLDGSSGTVYLKGQQQLYSF